MAFSTWSDLAAQMRNDLANGNWRTKSYEFDGVKSEYFSPEEFFRALQEVERRASEEIAAADGGVILRTSLRSLNR